MAGRDRSALDYDTLEALQNALAYCEIDPVTKAKDWELVNFDAGTSVEEVNNIDDEVERLMVLKDYNILETEVEPEFDEITLEAKRLFNVPIAVVSLVDVGRQWFKSIQGLDAKSTPRSCAFCAHVVKQNEKSAVMVVRDASTDPRFMNNPLVTGGPCIRFYAGCPLVSPEGPKLGTICIIDFKPRPEGLSSREKENLRQLASEVVYNMIARCDSN